MAEFDDADDVSLIALNYFEHANALLKDAVAGVRAHIKEDAGNSILSDAAWPHVKTIVTFKNPLILAESTWFLVALSANKNDQIIEHVGWSNVLRIVRADKRGGIALLGTLALNDKRGARVLKEQVPLLLNVGNSTDDKQIWPELAASFSYIALAERGAAVLTQKGIAGVIKNFFAENDSTLNKETFSLLHNLSLSRSAKVKTELVKQGMIKALLPFAENEEHELRGDACMIIARLAIEADDKRIVTFRKWLEGSDEVQKLAALHWVTNYTAHRDDLEQAIPSIFTLLETIINGDLPALSDEAKLALESVKAGPPKGLKESLSTAAVLVLPPSDVPLPPQSIQLNVPTSPSPSIRDERFPKAKPLPVSPRFSISGNSTPTKVSSPRKTSSSSYDPSGSGTVASPSKVPNDNSGEKIEKDSGKPEKVGKNSDKTEKLGTKAKGEKDPSARKASRKSLPRKTEALETTSFSEPTLPSLEQDEKVAVQPTTPQPKANSSKSKPIKKRKKDSQEANITPRARASEDFEPVDDERSNTQERRPKPRALSRSDMVVDLSHDLRTGAKPERSKSTGKANGKIRPQSMMPTSASSLDITKEKSPNGKKATTKDKEGGEKDRKSEKKTKKKKPDETPVDRTDPVADSFELLSKKDLDPLTALTALKRLLTVNNTELFLKGDYLSILLELVRNTSMGAVLTLVLNLLTTISRQNKTVQTQLFELKAINVYGAQLSKPETAASAAIALGALCYNNKQIRSSMSNSADVVHHLKQLLADPKMGGEVCAGLRDIVEDHPENQELFGGERELKAIMELMNNCSKKSQLRHIFGLMAALAVNNAKHQTDLKKAFPKLTQLLKEQQDDGSVLVSIISTLRALCDNNPKNVEIFFGEKPAKELTALLSHSVPEVQAESCALISTLIITSKGKRKKGFLAENIMNSLKLLDHSPNEQVRQAASACLKTFQEEAE